ncbi:serine--tRNA ligase [Leptospira sp. GIMC2001]|uniref:serine--tRNA ligase n=1 Tax=Leptospira sp. GIMC2001 TaxID=1513297 RepID=UPI002349E311|nr:serine--tRNA ligase [Leptospira sp. GIMC2001]WCL49509.1 serine--tRNA ligase [Leptospira sp. GIMC2001]
MLDLNRILNQPEDLVNLLKKRNMYDAGVENTLLTLIQSKRTLQAETDELRSERNSASKEIGALKAKGEDITSASDSVREIGNKIKELEEKLNSVETQLADLNLAMPNFLSDDVPAGKSEADNIEVSVFGKKREFNFDPKPHYEIGEALGILDFERGVKISGARFYTYFGLAAKMERALMNFMLDHHATSNGYQEVWVPSLVNDESLTATGQLPKFREEFYHLENDRLNLIPTAEVPLTNLYRDEIIADKDLPISIMAHTSCFRREAGSYGRDTRGLVRVHQFQKVELVKFCHPEDSQNQHEKMLKDAESILQKLNLHYRVVLLCSGDISASSSKTYDLEVWMPGLNRYMEISSVSNFQDYQARRAKIRYKNREGKNLLVHTLNGSGLAIGRTLAAILENYQTDNGQIEIPEVLKAYIR